MMDKNREAFEAWCMNQCNYDTSKKDRTGSYRSIRTTLAFKVWMASRQAIDFQLPDPKIYLCQGSAEAAILDIAGHLTSLGIRVKGNEE